jgi:hypothetical protein
MKSHSAVLVILFLLIGCSKKIDETPLFDPFEINYNVTDNSLVASGYKTMPDSGTDVLHLAKQVGDTLIWYQLEDNCDSLTVDCPNYYVSTRYCYVHLASDDSTFLSRLISKYDAQIISVLDLDNIRKDSAYYVEFGSHFFVKHRFTQQIFECSIRPDLDSIGNQQKGFELKIHTDFPWRKEKIERLKWLFENR